MSNTLKTWIPACHITAQSILAARRFYHEFYIKSGTQSRRKISLMKVSILLPLLSNWLRMKSDRSSTQVFYLTKSVIRKCRNSVFDHCCIYQKKSSRRLSVMLLCRVHSVTRFVSAYIHSATMNMKLWKIKKYETILTSSTRNFLHKVTWISITNPEIPARLSVDMSVSESQSHRMSPAWYADHFKWLEVSKVTDLALPARLTNCQ